MMKPKVDMKYIFNKETKNKWIPIPEQATEQMEKDTILINEYPYRF